MKAKYDSFVDIQALNEDLIRIENLYNPLVQRPRINLGGTSSKNPLIDRLVKPARKFTKLITKTKLEVISLYLLNGRL